MAVYDETWKEAMNQWFEPFVAFFFPHVHRGIDWGRGWEWLDNELKQVTRDAQIGEKRVDKLVKVWLRDGAEAWLLIHIEIQSQREARFERRMFVYHYRIFDLYNHQVVRLVVLGDDNPHWRPQTFGYEKWGCELSFRFPSVKLLDFAALENVLAASLDPIAAMVEAHLATLAEPKDAMSLFARERRIIRSLYERGMSKQTVLELFRLIHWMIQLPEPIERQFIQEHYEWEEEKKMPYVMPFELRAREEGEAKGKAEGKAEGLREGQVTMLLLLLEQRFGSPLPEELATHIRATRDTTLLEKWAKLLFAAASLDEFRQRMQS